MSRASQPGLTQNETNALSQFTEAIRAKLGGGVRRIVLFGSKARGDSDPDSDVDVLVIVRARSRNVDRIVGDAAFEASLQYDVLLAPVVFEEVEYESPLHRATGFYRSAEADGIVL